MLSNRLKRVAEFLQEPILFADIGSDHAYLPCYVCSRYNEATAIAGEVNEGPFMRAEQSVRENHLTTQIEVRKGNGLDVIEPSEVNQITIAGMGGKLIRTILEEGKFKLKGVQRLILQPNLDAPLIRKWLMENHYDIKAEEILEEDGYIYEIVVADVCQEKITLTEKEQLFGKYLLREHNNIFQYKWEKERESKKQLINQIKKATYIPESKIKQLEMEIDWIEEVLQNDNR